MNKDLRLFFCDESIKPYRRPNNEPIVASSYEHTSLSWAILLDSISSYDAVRVLNIENGRLTSFGWRHIVSRSTEKVCENCLLIKAHKKECDEESNSWNVRYIESDYYAAVFRNGEYLMSSAELEIVQSHNLIISHQNKNNGCYSLDGTRILRPLYDAIAFDSDKGLFSIELDGKIMTADTNGTFLLEDDSVRINLPKAIVSYERLKEELYIVAQYHNYPQKLLHGDVEYGIYNIKQKAYQVPCKYRSLQYVTDDIIIVSIGYDDHMGIIDIKGNVVVPLKYYRIVANYDNTISFQEKNYCYDFSTGLDLKRSVDNGDTQVLLPIYYEPKPFRHFGEPQLCYAKYYYGLCVVQRNGRYGVIDVLLDEIIPCEYDDVYCIDADEKALLFAALSGASITVIETFSGNRLSTKAKEIHFSFKDAHGRRCFVIGETSVENSHTTTRYGLMDCKGAFVFDAVYYSISPVCGDIIQLSVGYSKNALAKVDGTLLTDFVFWHADLRRDKVVVCETSNNSYYEDSDTAIYSKTGECIAALESRAKDFEVVSEDSIKVRFADDDYGFVFQLFSTSGEKPTTSRYSYIGAFRNNEALVKLGGYSFFSREDENGRHYGVRGGKFGVISAN